jgi:metal-sulfur cluster biosynthetic enzyme
MKIDRESIQKLLAPIEDPEMGLGIVELGLIYDISINDRNDVSITMTLTSPMCPLGPEITSQIKNALKGCKGIGKIDVELVWDPPWNPRDMASDEAKDKLGIW